MKLSSLLCAPLALFGCASGPASSAFADASALADEHAVAETVARFSAATADRDFATLGSLFIDDAVWEATGAGLGFRHVGASAIRAALAESGGRVTVVFQQSGPPLIRLDGTHRASARTSITELLRIEPGGPMKQISGVYTDELVKRDGAWRFARRRFDLRQAIDLPPSSAAPGGDR
ncbi:MAG: hypothetical protein K0S65_6067 [Labilithrix sp.]|nr:hypothetical protein [Labilithrix sp.]